MEAEQDQPTTHYFIELIEKYQNALEISLKKQESLTKLLEESQAKLIQINTSSSSKLGEVSTKLEQINNSMNRTRTEWNLKIHEYDRSNYLLKDAVNQLATREIIVNINNPDKPKIVYDSIKEEKTSEAISILEAMKGQVDPEDAEDEPTKIILVEKEIETLNKDGTVTLSTEVIEEEVCMTPEELVELKVADDIPLDDDMDKVKGLLVGAKQPSTLDTKMKPVKPIDVTVINNNFVNITITPKWIGQQFYRQSLVECPGINNLSVDVRKYAISSMKKWLNNNFNQDPSKKTGAMQRGLCHVLRGPALMIAQANYLLISGAVYDSSTAKPRKD